MQGFTKKSIIIAVFAAASATLFTLHGCNGSGGDGAGNAAGDAAGNGAAGGNGQPAASSFYDGPDLRSSTLYNPSAYITSQCYTKTEGIAGRIHNPCYSCHVSTREPNFVEDDDLQQAYSFPAPARQNPWINLFEDRSARIAAITDQQISDYIAGDNYFDDQGEPLLAAKLANPPAEWDHQQDGQWRGFVPDAYFNFDDQGFDSGPQGNPTGWRAFGYHPFLGTFWPTNGSTNDVQIRLDAPFRENPAGDYDRQTYRINLAIVEALISRSDVAIDPVDETLYDVDLDKDGVLGQASLIRYDWAPRQGRLMSYVGRAKQLQDDGELKLAAGLYPLGTEFLHSVRYTQADRQNGVRLAPRMKELRYQRKHAWLVYPELQDLALAEIKEKDDFPERLRNVVGNLERGVNNGRGWTLAGFIEDARGDLRPQTYEELVFCVGCHGGIGAVTDSTFSFPRKLPTAALQQGWYHWTQKGLKDLPEPLRADGRHEYSCYLEQNGAGDELRANQEVLDKFFDANGELNPAATALLQNDITELLAPSESRALQLNKAYRVIVEDQDFIHGRDATLGVAVNVHQSITEGQLTGVVTPLTGPYTR